MTFEEFEKANSQQLRHRAKYCFDFAQRPQMMGDSSNVTALLEAQFYMQEIDRRHDSRISLRDLVLEITVIALIGWEILMGYQQDAVLTKLQESAAATAATLTSLQQTTEKMNTAIQRQTALLTEVSVEITYDAAQKRINVTNKGNANLEMWGNKLDIGPRSIEKEPRIITRGSFYYIIADSFYNEALSKFSPGSDHFVPFEVYFRSDDGTEYVATCKMLVKSIKGSANIENRLEIHTQTTSISPRRWSR
jgi:hypothetical protein